VVEEAVKTNEYFQSESAVPCEMLEKLTEFHSALTLRIKTSSGQNRHLENIDFGIRFKIKLSKCLNKYAESPFNQAALTVQQTCANFLLSLVQECDKRLLPNQGPCRFKSWLCLKQRFQKTIFQPSHGQHY